MRSNNHPLEGDVVVHRASGSKYLVTAVTREDSYFGEMVLKFQVVETGSPRRGPYLLQQNDIGVLDSNADYFLETKISQNTSAESFS